MPGMFGGDQLDDDYAPWSKTKVEQSNDSGLNISTWQERAKTAGDWPLFSGDAVAPYLKAEVDDLRAEFARRADLANQPAPTVPAFDLSKLKQEIRKVLKHHKLTKHGDGVVEADLADLLHKSFLAYQPAQEQASTTRVTETKRTQLEARGYEVVGYVMQNSVNERCTLTHGRVEWLKS